MSNAALRLKSQVSRLQPSEATHLPVVDVWVDTQLPHLDHRFSYLLPQALADVVEVGSLVQVPFHGRELQAMVVERHNRKVSDLKFVSKALSPFPLLTASLISSITEFARKWIAHPFDFVSAAIPERAISIERRFQEAHPLTNTVHSEPGLKTFLQMPPVHSRIELVVSRIEKAPRGAKVLVLLPDLRTVEDLAHHLDGLGRAFIRLDSTLSRTQLYENFLSLIIGESNIVIGTRNAVFAPLRNLHTMIIVDEFSEHYYDRRSPGWNVRDCAIIRSDSEGINIDFLGYTLSSDLARMIDEGRIRYIKCSGSVKVSVAEQSHAELLPSKAVTMVRKSLNNGPVLFITPAKGYAQAIKCASCRSISKCECGGSLVQRSRLTDIECMQCSRTFPGWRCSWCDHPIFHLSKRGIDRFAFELGALFPKVPIATFTADEKESRISFSGIVIATPGMAPFHQGNYSAVVILEGNRFLSQPDLRSEERVRGYYFSAAAMAKKGGDVILVQDLGHPITTGLQQWNPVPLIHRHCEELKNLNLPPYVVSLTFTTLTSEVMRVKNALEKAQGVKLPASLRILGPSVINENESKFIVLAAIEDENLLLETIHEFLRKRSATKKLLPTVRAYPYSLSLLK